MILFELPSIHVCLSDWFKACIIILPSQLIMRRQYNTQRNLTYSQISDNSIAQLYPHLTQAIYQSRPTTNTSSYSRQRTNQRSLQRQTNLQPSIASIQNSVPTKQPEIVAVRDNRQENYKQNLNVSNIDVQSITMRFIHVEGRLKETEGRLQRMERQNKNNDLINKNVEQMMQMQLKDIHFNEELEERLVLIESMIGHVKSTKIDKKQLELVEHFKNSSVERLNYLAKRSQQSEEDISEIKGKLQKLVSTIETSLVGIGQKYEEFIESNIIKSIDQVNKLTQYYQQEIENFKKENVTLSMKMEKIANIQMQEKAQIPNIASISKSMIGISIPYLRVIQTVSILNTRKQRAVSFKDQKREQLRQAKQTMDHSKIGLNDNILNSMYDPIEQLTQNSSSELLLERVIYKIDLDFHLLDDQDFYITDANGQKIQLSKEQVSHLREEGLLEE